MRYIVLLLITYLGFSFIAWDFNIGEWSSLMRIISAVTYFTFICCAEMAFAIDSNDRTSSQMIADLLDENKKLELDNERYRKSLEESRNV